MHGYMNAKKKKLQYIWISGNVRWWFFLCSVELHIIIKNSNVQRIGFITISSRGERTSLVCSVFMYSDMYSRLFLAGSAFLLRANCVFMVWCSVKKRYPKLHISVHCRHLYSMSLIYIFDINLKSYLLSNWHHREELFLRMLHTFFWVIPCRLNFICRRFGHSICSIFIGG